MDGIEYHARRRSMLSFMVLFIALYIILRNKRKRALSFLLLKKRKRIGDFYVLHRSVAWFDRFVSSEDRFDDQRWRSHFKVPRKLYEELVEKLTPHIQSADTRFRVAIPSSKIVAAALYFIGQGVPLGTISELFAIGISKLSEVFPLVFKAIVAEYRDVVVFDLDPEALANRARQFIAAGFVQGCVGAIDCTHIVIRKPDGPHGADYFDRKHCHSVVAQVMVDANGRILHTSIGWPGSIHDARILHASGLQTTLEELAPKGYYVIGDSGYPALSCLVTPHPNQHLRKYKNFNYHHSASRIVVERTFGALKMRFAALDKEFRLDVKTIPYIFKSCCILHNLMLSDFVVYDADLDATSVTPCSDAIQLRERLVNLVNDRL